MQKDFFTSQSRLLSISIRLGLSLTLGILAVLLLIDLASVASPALAPSNSHGHGDLDTTFGSGGIVTTAIGPSYDYAYAVSVQPDGKIVAAGHADSGSDYNFAVMRYTVSGDLDVTFGNGGVVTTPIGPGSDTAQAVTIQPDGKIVAAGYADNGRDDELGVARCTVAGALDPTIGNGGAVTTPIGTD